MQKNDLVTVAIEDIGVGGEGIGKVDGYTLFIKDAIIGDVVEAKIVKAKKNYGYARLMNIVTPSENRVEKPACPMARRCGGCQIQEMKYGAQLAFKEGKVRGNLERIGEVPTELLDKVMQPIVGMEEPFHYRNKAQFPFGTDKEGNVVTGFYAARSHNIIPCTECWLGVEENRETLEKILAHLKKFRIPAYDEKTGKGLLRHVLVRTGYMTGQIMVVLVVSSPIFPSKNHFVKALRAQHPEISTVVLNVNDRKTSMVLGPRNITLYGKGYIEDQLCGCMFRISPTSFYQINPVQTEKLYKTAMMLARLNKRNVVVDAYCGIGTIGMVAAKTVKEVIGVELNAEAVRDAQSNARRNNMKNIRFVQGDAGVFLEGMADREEATALGNIRKDRDMPVRMP